MARWKWFMMALWLGACLSCLALAAAAAESINRALLIGCDKFVTQEDTTPSAAGNVTRVANALSGGAMNLESLVTRREGIEDEDELAELIAEAFAGADEDDVSYLYLSTHGVWNDEADARAMEFILSDGTVENSVTGVSLRAMLDRVPGTKVLLLDACHSGSIIGKGVDEGFVNLFEGEDYKVICSSGGVEESWLWSSRYGGAEKTLGASYFSETLSAALSSAGGYAADSNRDGVITLTELKRYLRLNYGASTVQTYPEEDDFPLLTYAVSTYTNRRRGASVENIVFEGSVLSASSPEINLTFTVLRDVQVAYQLVYQKEGRWDFSSARLVWDNAERFGAYGDAQGYLSPGYKERSITLSGGEGGNDYGYVLLQVLTMQDGDISVAASRVLCIPPAQGDPLLTIDGEEDFAPEAGEELTFVVRHLYPCELSVTVEDATGVVVSRLASRQATRPEQLVPTGSTFTWNGLTTDGERAADGSYVIRVTAYVGEERYTLLSTPVRLHRAL